MQNRRILPKVRDRISFLYVDQCRVEQEGRAILILRADYSVQIPCANLATLMLGPGVSITSAAIKTLAASNCCVVWVGLDGLRFYAAGTPKGSSDRLMHQAIVWAAPDQRMTVVRRMYRIRFGQDLDPDLTLRQIRGMEGSRIKALYRTLGEQAGVSWEGRNYQQDNWDAANPINQALSIANTCLYAIVQSAIAAVGYSAGLGFVHQGNRWSFVYDIADLYKATTTIPAAFEVVGNGFAELDAEVRQVLRQKLFETRVMKTLVQDIDVVLGYQGGDGSGKVLLWDDQEAWVDGGTNWGGP